VYAPTGAGKVRISGSNQQGQVVEWNGVCKELYDPVRTLGEGVYYGVQTDNWWWKGKVDIWWNDSNATAQYLSTDIPVNQLGNWWVLTLNDPAGQGGHTVKPPQHGKH